MSCCRLIRLHPWRFVQYLFRSFLLHDMWIFRWYLESRVYLFELINPAFWIFFRSVKLFLITFYFQAYCRLLVFLQGFFDHYLQLKTHCLVMRWPIWPLPAHHALSLLLKTSKGREKVITPHFRFRYSNLSGSGFVYFELFDVKSVLRFTCKHRHVVSWGHCESMCAVDNWIPEFFSCSW